MWLCAVVVALLLSASLPQLRAQLLRHGAASAVPATVNGTTLHAMVAELSGFVDAAGAHGDHVLDYKVQDLNSQLRLMTAMHERDQVLKKLQREAAARRAAEEGTAREEAARRAADARVVELSASLQERDRALADKDVELRQTALVPLEMAKSLELAPPAGNTGDAVTVGTAIVAHVRQVMATVQGLERNVHDLTHALTKCGTEKASAKQTTTTITSVAPPPPCVAGAPDAPSLVALQEPYHSWWTLLATATAVAFVALYTAARRQGHALQADLIAAAAATEAAAAAGGAVAEDAARANARADALAGDVARLQGELQRAVRDGADDEQAVAEARERFKEVRDALQEEVRGLEMQLVRRDEAFALLESSSLAAELQMSQLKGKLAAAEADAAGAHAAAAELKGKLAKAEAELKSKLAKAEADAASAHAAAAELRSKLAAEEANAAGAHAAAAELKSKLVAAEANAAGAHAAAAEAQRQTEAVRTEMGGQVASLSASVAAAHASMSQAAQETDAKVQRELEALTTRLAAAEASAAQVRDALLAEQQQLLREKEQLVEEHRRLVAAAAAADAALAQAQVSEAQAVADLRQQVAALETQVKGHQRTTFEHVTEIATLREHNAVTAAAHAETQKTYEQRARDLQQQVDELARSLKVAAAAHEQQARAAREAEAAAAAAHAAEVAALRDAQVAATAAQHVAVQSSDVSAARVKELLAEARKAEDERVAVAAQLAKAQDDLKVAVGKTQAVTADRDALLDRSNELKAQIKALQKRVAAAEQDRDALLAQNAEAEMQLSALSKQAAEAEKETNEETEGSASSSSSSSSSSRSWFRNAIVEEKAVSRSRYDQMATDLEVAQRDVADLKRHVVEITLKRVEEEDGRHAAVGDLEDTVASLRRQLRAVKEEAMMMEEHISELQREKVALIAKNATCELLILSLEDKTSSTALTPLQETPLRHKVVSLESRLKEFESLAVENHHFHAAIESIKQQMMTAAAGSSSIDLRTQTATTTGGSPGGPQELSFTDDEPGSPAVGGAGSLGSPPTTPPSIQLADLQECGPVFGSGTFGRVRLVAERTTKKMYALKAMLKSEIVAHKQQQNVLLEKKILSAVDHPFIVKLYSTFHDARKLYMLLEFVQGGELFAVVHTTKTDGIPDAQAKFYAAGIILALGYLHKKDIAYRDLKPENCLIDAHGYPKLIDFGFAKVLAPGDTSHTMCGTAEYLAPEQVQGHGHTRAVDYWAFGVLCYEMLTGVSPFVDADHEDDTPTEHIFEYIVSRPVAYPDDPAVMGLAARSLVGALLVRPPSGRLGTGPGGADDVLRHPWFADLDLDLYGAKRLPPPWTPPVVSSTDLTHFATEGIDDHGDGDAGDDGGPDWCKDF